MALTKKQRFCTCKMKLQRGCVPGQECVQVVWSGRIGAKRRWCYKRSCFGPILAPVMCPISAQTGCDWLPKHNISWEKKISQNLLDVTKVPSVRVSICIIINYVSAPLFLFCQQFSLAKSFGNSCESFQQGNLASIGNAQIPLAQLQLRLFSFMHGLSPVTNTCALMLLHSPLN